MLINVPPASALNKAYLEDASMQCLRCSLSTNIWTHHELVFEIYYYYPQQLS